ncbi:hypothetical protein D6T65_15310 [Arthrobacter frigidicola]|nr:hypothetical protein D6T65_15310 [Arthrobacter frigidicola]
MPPTAPARSGRGVRGFQLSSMAAIIGAVLLISGCSTPGAESAGLAAGPAQVPRISAGSSVDSPQAGAGETPATASGDSADQAPHNSIDAALGELVESSPRPSREQIRATLRAAGIADDSMEISATTTPTGLTVDAVQAGVRSGEDCLVAHLQDGSVSTVILPVLAGGRCLIGGDRG